MAESVPLENPERSETVFRYRTTLRLSHSHQPPKERRFTFHLLITFGAMFKGYYLRWRRNQRVNAFNAQIIQARSAGDFVAVKKLIKNQSEVLNWENLNVEFFESQRAVDAADRLDVELPSGMEADCWILGRDEGQVLTSKGRALVRQRIHDEEMRRFELRSRWIKLMTPIIAAIAGVIGTITGLVSVLRK